MKSILEESGIEVLSLNDFPAIGDIPESGSSFFENSLHKARTVHDFTGEPALADDSGLEVDALGGRPGIFSARYSGENSDDKRNLAKLLWEMKAVPAARRGATFRCVIVLYGPDGRYKSFEGEWKGQIAVEPRGDKGFGYDPVFFDPELNQTAAEMEPEVKNSRSHRAKALLKFKNSLHQLSENEKK